MHAEHCTGVAETEYDDTCNHPLPEALLLLLSLQT